MIDLSPESWALKVTYSAAQVLDLRPVGFSHPFQKRLIKVRVSSTGPTVKSTWRRGGYLNQFYEQQELSSVRVPLNRPKILVLPNYGEGPYTLEFRPVGLYLPNVALAIWEHRGEDVPGITQAGDAGTGPALTAELEQRFNDLPQQIVEQVFPLLDAGEINDAE